MYQTSNNVKLNMCLQILVQHFLTINADATSLTLASASNFPTGSITVKINNEIITFNTTLSSLTSDVNEFNCNPLLVYATIELYQILEHINEINKTHNAIANINMDSYTNTLTTAPTITGRSTTAEVMELIFASENYRYELGKTLIMQWNYQILLSLQK